MADQATPASDRRHAGRHRPFVLVEGFSGINGELAIVGARPLASTWLTTDLERSDRVVLEATPDYWDDERGPPSAAHGLPQRHRTERPARSRLRW